MEDIVAVVFFATGYYSDRSESQIVFFPKSIHEKYKYDVEDIAMYFYDLDGKHSEIEASVYSYTDPQSIAEAFDANYVGYDMAVDYIGEILEDADLKTVIELTKRIHKETTVTVSTVVKYNGIDYAV